MSKERCELCGQLVLESELTEEFIPKPNRDGYFARVCGECRDGIEDEKGGKR